MLVENVSERTVFLSSAFIILHGSQKKILVDLDDSENRVIARDENEIFQFRLPNTTENVQAVLLDIRKAGGRQIAFLDLSDRAKPSEFVDYEPDMVLPFNFQNSDFDTGAFSFRRSITD